MLRLRFVVLLASVVLAIGVAPVVMAGEDEAPARDTPAVEFGDAAEPEADEAWTFRFLVPTLIAMSALGLAATGLAYMRRVKTRYRVER